MRLELNIKLNKRMINKVKGGSAEIQKHTRQALDAIGQYAASEVRIRVPIDTGRLRRSITSEVRGDDKVIVGTHIVYARIQEYGGEIRPKRKKILAWVERPQGSRGRFAERPRTPAQWAQARKQSKARYAKRVHLKPQRYFQRGIATVRQSDRPTKIFKRALRNALLEIGFRG